MLKKVLFGASLTLGIGLFIGVIVFFGGIHKTFEVIGEVGWLGLALFLLNAAMPLVAPAVGWNLLLRSEGMKIPFWTTMKANMMGFPINFVAPSMFLGAEPLKMYYVSHLHDLPKRKILATVIVSKLQELGGLIFIMLLGAIITVWKIKLPAHTSAILMVAMAAICAGFALAIVAFLRNWKPSVKVVNFIAGIGNKGMIRRRKFAKLRNHAREMEYIIRRFFTHHWKTFVVAQLITMLSSLSILIRPWIFYHFAKHTFIGMEILCAVYVVTNLINIVPHTPGGLGIFEGGMVALWALLGLPKEDAAAFSLVNRFADVALILIGVWFIIHYNLQSIAKNIAKGEVKAPTAHDAVSGDSVDLTASAKRATK